MEEEQGKLLAEEWQFINVRLLELENQYFAITIVIIDSDNNPQ